MSGDRDEPDVGSVAEEAAKLLGALSDWAKDTTHDVESHLATGAAECTYCPICRTVHAVRGLSPEVRAQLATAASSALQAVAGLLGAVAAESNGPPKRGGVEHIDLDDDLDDDLDGDLDDDLGEHLHHADDWPDDTAATSDRQTDPEEGDR